MRVRRPREEPVWLSRQALGVIHYELVVEHGGNDGVRSEFMIESAMSRPLMKWAAGESDLFVLAAAYAFGLARNRGFVDGNKAVALAAALVFLAQNGITPMVHSADAVAHLIGIESGSDTEPELADWLRSQSSGSGAP